MDRYAIFVDVGYVYAAGGSLVLDTPDRNRIRVDAGELLTRLHRVVADHFERSGDFLRAYWYDAAPNAIPQLEHEEVAAESGIKVRLGRLTRNGQKGVDALVLRDMMKLASEHAICTAFLVAGDDDLRQGVIEAQDYGVKVILIGIQPTFGQNQAPSLVHEADASYTLGYDELADCFSEATGSLRLGGSLDSWDVGYAAGSEWATAASEQQLAEFATTGFIPQEADSALIHAILEAGDLPPSVQLPAGTLRDARAGFREAVRSREQGPGESPPAVIEAPAPAATSATPAAAAAVPAPLPSPAPIAPPAAAPVLSVPADVPADQVFPYREGLEFGATWLNQQPEEEVRYVRGGFPYLPRDIDVDLLRHLVAAMGFAPGALIDDKDRRAGRAGFWQALGLELDFGQGRRATRPSYEPIAERDPFAFGRAFAEQWMRLASPGDVEGARNLASKRVGLPFEADAQLLRAAADVFGDPVPVDARHRLRAGFSERLMAP